MSSVRGFALLIATLGALAGCHREAPTELGPATAAVEPQPPPAPTVTPSRITPDMVAAAEAIGNDIDEAAAIAYGAFEVGASCAFGECGGQGGVNGSHPCFPMGHGLACPCTVCRSGWNRTCQVVGRGENGQARCSA